MTQADAQAAIAKLTAALFPEEVLTSIEPLGADTSRTAVAKKTGYSRPLKVTLQARDGARRHLVFRTATTNEFGHDRRSDRAEAMLLAYDTFGLVPNHVQALDVGAIMAQGPLQSVRGSEEFYLLTTFAEGTPYSDDLRTIAQQARVYPVDLQRCEALARYLVSLHSGPMPDGQGYRRAIRDLLGHGEGIFGIIDSYPANLPTAPFARLKRIEQQCLEWRWRLRDRQHRLRRTHGDFHPFNIVFASGADFTLLDASRGCQGDPADDVTALAINYVFFAADAPAAWEGGLRTLWRNFWSSYLAGSADSELLHVAAPFLTWRSLVVANPRFYPALSDAARNLLLDLAERALAVEKFDPSFADDLFR